MEKFLIIQFKNAGLFTNKGTLDYIFDLDGRRKRSDAEFFEEPITVFQISNMLHVLFGERPVPSLREVMYSKNAYYFNMANESFLKISSFKKFDKRTGKDEFVPEKMHIKKAVFNSWNPSSILYWDRVRRYLEDDLYADFLSILESELNIKPIKYTFVDAIKIILSSTNPIVTSFMDNLTKNGKSGLVNDMKSYFTDKQTSQINMNPRTVLNVTKGIENVYRLDGTILIPVNNNDIEKLRTQSKGCATLLDGGAVFIEKIVLANSLSTDGFIQVKDISTKKY